MISCQNELKRRLIEDFGTHVYGDGGTFWLSCLGTDLEEVSFGAIAALEKTGFLNRIVTPSSAIHFGLNY